MLALCPLLLHRDLVLSALLKNADSFRDNLFAFAVSLNTEGEIHFV